MAVVGTLPAADEVIIIRPQVSDIVAIHKDFEWILTVQVRDHKAVGNLEIILVLHILTGF